MMSMNSGCRQDRERNGQQHGVVDKASSHFVVSLVHREKRKEQDINCPGFFITFKEAPPTRKPSTSGCAPSSLQFAAVTEPVAKGTCGLIIKMI
jgi:hypothetical protein